MRKHFGQALRLGVCANGMALLKTSRWQGEALSVLAEHRCEPGELAQGARALLGSAGASRWPLTIVLADELVRTWQVTPPQDATRLVDLQAAAALRFQALYGEPAAGWKLTASWDARRPFLAAALPQALLAQLEQAAAEHGMPVVEIAPQFIAAWNRWRSALKPGAWFGQVERQVLTTAQAGAPGLGAPRAVAVPQGADHAWLAGHLAREALRLNLPLPERLQLCGQVDPEWSQVSAQLDCSVLGAAWPAAWSPAARLAATGSRA